MSKQTVIRLKRLRDELPHEIILIEESRAAKRPNIGLLNSFPALSTSTTTEGKEEADLSTSIPTLTPEAPKTSSFVFQRIDSILATDLSNHEGASSRVMSKIKHSRKMIKERINIKIKGDDKESQILLKMSKKKEEEKDKRYKQVERSRLGKLSMDKDSIGAKMRVVDIEEKKFKGEVEEESVLKAICKANASSVMVCDGVPIKRVKENFSVSRPMIPLEEAMDKAIWTAFKKGTFDDVFRLIAKGVDVNFPRYHSDHTTSIMAASFFLNYQVINELLVLGGRASLKDKGGRNSVDWANIAIDIKMKNSAFLLTEGDVIVLKKLEEAVELDHQDDLREKDEENNNNNNVLASATLLFPPLAVAEDDKYVYDYFVLQPMDMDDKENVSLVSTAPVITIEENYDELMGTTCTLEEEQWALENGLFDSDEEASEKGDDEEDSNDEEYFANDYPDESEHESDAEKIFDREEDDSEFENEDRNDFYERNHFGDDDDDDMEED